ncbi:MAG: hypothetical protein FWC87_15080 [Acidimicrobiaceae bacterium]|nr:hypothetical protein [Acidimicrobiaceae bacterium]
MRCDDRLILRVPAAARLLGGRHLESRPVHRAQPGRHPAQGTISILGTAPRNEGGTLVELRVPVVAPAEDDLESL